MTKKKKVAVVMPAYFAEQTLEKTYRDIPKKYVDDIILVDDASKDNTVKIAKKLGLTVVVHEKNKGYGANQKTCYKTALKRGADIIVLLHPDYQYDPKKIPEMIKPLQEGKADAVYGSRMLAKGGAAKGGMPAYKRIGNFFLTTFMNVTLGTKFTDAATGYIAYSRKVLEKIAIEKLSDGFTFDEEAIIQCAANKFRIKEIPIPTRYEVESSSISFSRSIEYGWNIFKEIIKSKLHK
ncbi:glycosyltransferase family 2 protein [Candidatus Woesearchaeota archaeon]|nr:glycosyltransferase family 2 protein [Candidatus Woesearchaeota archaeon]